MIVVAREDVLEVRDLADIWKELPALEILQADGLDKIPAKDLFDSISGFVWRAQVNFSGLGGPESVERVIRLAQGAQYSWMAQPIDDNIEQIRVETVQEGELEEVLRACWADVSG